MCSGTPVNNDYRLTAVNGGIYFLLTRDDMNFAVPMLQARSSAPNAEAR